MNEEIARARKRAEAASSRKNGFSYQSPLGNGFSFEAGKSREEQSNPFSRKSRQSNQSQQDGFQIQYEEAYFEMNTSDLSHSRRVINGKESVIERANHRRKHRVRERGEPNPYNNRRRRANSDDESAGCNIM